MSSEFPHLVEGPRIRARVGQILPPDSDAGKWIFTIIVSLVTSAEKLEEKKDFGPFETEAIAKARSELLVKELIRDVKKDNPEAVVIHAKTGKPV